MNMATAGYSPLPSYVKKGALIVFVLQILHLIMIDIAACALVVRDGNDKKTRGYGGWCLFYGIVTCLYTLFISFQVYNKSKGSAPAGNYVQGA